MDPAQGAIEMSVEAVPYIGAASTDVQLSSVSDDWYTPEWLIDLARDTLGAIDLDPASSEKANLTVGARKYFTIDDEGLARSWAGRVFLNPPFSRMAEFMKKAAYEYEDGAVDALVLIGSTGCISAGYTKSVEPYAMWVPYGRPNFTHASGKSNSSPSRGTIVWYLGDDIDRFVMATKNRPHTGVVYTPVGG